MTLPLVNLLEDLQHLFIDPLRGPLIPSAFMLKLLESRLAYLKLGGKDMHHPSLQPSLIVPLKEFANLLVLGISRPRTQWQLKPHFIDVLKASIFHVLLHAVCYPKVGPISLAHQVSVASHLLDLAVLFTCIIVAMNLDLDFGVLDPAARLHVSVMEA